MAQTKSIRASCVAPVVSSRIRSFLSGLIPFFSVLGDVAHYHSPDHLARVHWFSASALNIASLLILREQWFNVLPELFR